MLVVLKKHEHLKGFVLKCKTITVTNDLRVFSGVDADGHLVFFALNGAYLTLTDTTVKCHLWQENLYPCPYELLAVVKPDLWHLYQVTIAGSEISIRIKSSWSWKDLEFETILDDCQMEILKFSGSEAVFSLQNREIIKVTLSEGFHPEWQLSFTVGDSEAKCIRCLAQRVYTLHDACISAYDLKDGTKCLQWNLGGICDPGLFWTSPEADKLLLQKGDKLLFVSPSTSIAPAACRRSRKPVISAFVKQLRDRKHSSSERLCERYINLESGLVSGLVMCANHVICLLRYKDYSELKVVEFDSGKMVACERLEKSSVLVASLDPSYLPLILSGDVLQLLLLGTSPTRLVNELMMYTGGAVVHSLSQLNKWQDITVDFDVFEIGLRNRQLDTISFFLKAKTEEFHAFWRQLNEEAASTEVIKAFLQELTVMLGFLCRTVENYFCGPSTSLNFAEQLLRVDLQTVLDLLALVSDEVPSPKFFPSNELTHPSDILMQHLTSMRRYLSSSSSKVIDVPEMKFVSSVVGRWTSEVMSSESIIQDAVLHGHVPLAHWYLSNQHGNVTLDEVRCVGLAFAEEILMEGKFQDARDVIHNLGLSVDEQLLRLARTTTVRSLRMLLLNKIGKILSEEDLEAARFMEIGEALYPCSNYEVALRSHSGIQDSLMENEYSSPMEENFDYCKLSLELVKSWDVESREMILVPGFIHGKCFEIQPCASTVWIYLLQHGDLDRLLTWVHIFYEKETGVGFPYGLSIDLAMVNSIKGRTMQHVEDVLLDELAKYGIICEEELEDINLLLRRLGRAGCSLGAPFEREGSSLLIPDFNHRVVHYCLDHNLLRFLYRFLSTDERYRHCTPCPICHVPLLFSMLSFCHWIKQPDDEGLLLQAILSSAQFTHSLIEPTAVEVCLNTSPLLAAATSLFTGECPAELNSALRPVPLLQYAFASSFEVPSDISVYQLLHGNAAFDPTRLFGWQTTNTLKTEDAPNELPNFSLSSLVQKYGLHQELDFTYYLTQGRPNFAYLKFVAQELLTLGNLNTSRIQDACMESTLLAIANFSVCKITAACVVFTELLGQSSLSLRVDLQVASTMQTLELASPADIVSQLQTCQEDVQSTKEIASLLSSAVPQLKRNDAKDIFKPGDLRSLFLLVQFCQLHGVEVETSFLKNYARKDDWLAFLVIAQIFQISREQLLRLIPEFTSECLAEHLTHFLQIKHPRGRLDVKDETRKDHRSSLLTKIGLKKSHTPWLRDSSPSIEVSSDEDRISLTSEEGIPPLIDQDDGTDNLLEMLYVAFKSDSPADFLLKSSQTHQNPVLALFAASFTDAPILSCMCTWIIATLADETSPYDDHLWTQNDLERLLLEVVARNQYHHLHRIFFLFKPESFFLDLSEFLLLFWREKRYYASLAKLHQIEKNKIMLEEPSMQEFAVKLLMGSLSSPFAVAYEVKIFVNHLASTKEFDGEGLSNFKKLNELLQCLGDATIDIPIRDLLQPAGSESFLRGVWKIIQELQQAKMFQNASRFGKVANLRKDQVLLSQLNVEALGLSKDECRKKFWERCDETMRKHNISPEYASNFFRDWCDKVDCYQEKFFLTHLRYSWVRDTICEKDMWLFCIKAVVELNSTEAVLEAIKEDSSLEWELNAEPILWDPPHIRLSRQEESSALSRLLNSLLDTGHFGQAMRLSSIFQHPCLDMDIITVCLKLARCQIKISEVDATFLKQPVIEKKNTQVSAVVGKDPILDVMIHLSDLVVHGKPVCNKIMVHYRTSKFLSWTYEQVAEQRDSLALLENILTSRPSEKFDLTSRPLEKFDLTSRSSEKFDLAKRLIFVRGVTDGDVISFLAAKISQSLRSSLGMTAQPMVIDVQDSAFHLFLGLCEDPSMLGKRILFDAQQESDELNEKELSLMVELYIRAHDCFTASSNTESIARVLRKARKMTLLLTETQNFHLMVRLLTGIGRYSEMTYIFDILHENSAFELLLKKGTEKLPLLKFALLNYLKQQHASNIEIHSMLALKFGMFREVAEILESSCHEKLKKLKKDCGKQELEIIVQDFGAAAKSYKRAGCYRHAQVCARRANLISLQVALLASATWVLDLEGEAVREFIVERHKFSEAYVVAEAYQEKQAWDVALYANVVQRADWDYLRDFRTHLGLNTTIIESIARRFCSNRSSRHAQNMKQLLNFCVDMEAKYSLAKLLDFDDVAQDLLSGDAGAYLHDLAAKGLK